MPYVEVQPDPYVRKNYVKLREAGAKFEGYYLKDEPGNFEGKQDFHFRAADGSLNIVSAGKQLRKLLDKAGLSTGHKVFIAVKSLKNIPDLTYPVPEYKLGVDANPKPAMPEAAGDADPLDDF